jgi:hypothetical protein
VIDVQGFVCHDVQTENFNYQDKGCENAKRALEKKLQSCARPAFLAVVAADISISGVVAGNHAVMSSMPYMLCFISIPKGTGSSPPNRNREQ